MKLLFINFAPAESQLIRMRAEDVVHTNRSLGAHPARWKDRLDLPPGDIPYNFIFVKITEHFIAKCVVKGWVTYLFEFLEGLSERPHILFLHQNVIDHSLSMILGRSMSPYRLVQSQFLDRSSDPPLIRGFTTTVYAEDCVYDFQAGLPLPGDVLVNTSPCYLDELLGYSPTYPNCCARTDPFTKPYIDEIDSTISKMREHVDLTIFPYKYNYQLDEIIASSLDDPDSLGDHLRLFIPINVAAKLQAERLLDLLRTYCSGIGLDRLKILKKETSEGIHFIFRFDDGKSEVGMLNSVITEFHKLVDASINSPDAARRGLEDAGLSPIQSSYIVQHIRTEVSRIKFDLEFSEKSRMLELERSMKESLLLSGTSAYSPIPEDRLLSKDIADGIVSLVNPVFVLQIGHEFFDPESAAIYELISERASGLERATLASDLAAMNDVELPRADKSAPLQRLQKFVRSNAEGLRGFTVEVIARFLDLKTST